MRAAEPVAKLLIEAIQRGGCSPDAIERELDVGSTRGTAIPRRLLGDVQRLKSIAELHALRLSRRLRRPPTHWNVKLYGPEGDYIGYPDAWWDDVGLAWEIDSQEWHSAGQRYAGTISRNTRYTVSGILVVQTLPNRLLTDPNGVLADLTRAYRTASVRPRPDVVVAES